jgi:hypothetical protein
MKCNNSDDDNNNNNNNNSTKKFLFTYTHTLDPAFVCVCAENFEPEIATETLLLIAVVLLSYQKR